VLDVRTLKDGGQQAVEVAGWIADFVGSARRTLDLAQYDFHLLPETAAVVCGALRDAHGRGVAVRLVYNVDHRNPIPVPPPPEPDVALIASLGLPARAIAGVPDLMHHKYVIRDGEAVWTGSMNWTDDSFSHQENVVAAIESPEIARAFSLDFEHLWETGDVLTGGRTEPRRERLDGLEVRAWFTPGFGEELSQRIATAIGSAKQRVRICSPVITTGPVLGTLAQAIDDGRLDVAGCVDQTQMQEVVYQWRENGNVAWKLPLLLRVADEGRFSAKRSTKWRPEGSLHDFMHAKVTVADDRVFVGSFNLSRSGEKNAENVLEIRSAELAERLAAYVDEVRGRYPDLELA
jgi:phosphatidylserine/phosphatidylglycerophosphate/cardiolipin synthase-like enzyme